MGEETAAWIILRTAGRSTLVLAASLAEDGFDVWTPAKTQTISMKREVRLPMLPSFVFAKAHQLTDLIDLSGMAFKPRRRPAPGEERDRPAHRDFSVFRYLGTIPMISDHHLDPLRLKEREAIPRKGLPSFNRGQLVRVNSGAFQGLFGRVERCKSGFALVIFTDWKRPVKIPTFLLAEDVKFIDHRQAQRAA
jgi:hypothetical protein